MRSLLAALALWLAFGQAMAQETMTYNIAPQQLSQALVELARTTGHSVDIEDIGCLEGRRSAGVRGTYPLSKALELLLEGTGSRAHLEGEWIYIRCDADLIV